MMSNQTFHMTDSWSPYISVQDSVPLDTSGGNNVLRALLMDKAQRQAGGITAAIERGEIQRLPPVVQSLDQETSGFVTKRILNMLLAFRRFLVEPRHADVREKLESAFSPMDAWVSGQHCITSPVLLVVQSILYSHSEWFREEVHEAFSATRAFEELQGFPEQHRRFIAAIIAHQTLLRAAWSTDREHEPKEVLAFYKQDQDDGDIIWAEDEFADEDRAKEWADQIAGRGLARTLFPFLKESGNDEQRANDVQPAPLRRQLAAALVLHSLCLYCRHRSTEEVETLTKVKNQALGFLEHLLALEDGQWSCKPHLVFLQYGRYVQQSNSQLFKKVKEYLVDEYLKNGKLQNITFCFQRVPTKRVWSEENFVKSNIETKSGINNEFKELGLGIESGTIGGTILNTVGIVLVYHPADQDYLLKALGLEPTANSNQSELREWLENPENKGNQKNALKKLLAVVGETHLNYVKNVPNPNSKRYLPTPLVGQVLRQMRDARPQAFTALHIISRGIRGSSSQTEMGDSQFTIWLPNYEPEVPLPQDDDPNAVVVWEKQYDEDPDRLIARYVAAMVIGQAVSLTPREILLDYYSNNARDKWRGVIEQALHENGGPLMQTYLAQLRCKPVRFRSLSMVETHDLEAIQNSREKIENEKDVWVVGVDAGNTGIKISRYAAATLVSPTGAGNPKPKHYKTVKYARFKITEQSLNSLQSEGVPDGILEDLKGIKDQEIKGEKKFLDKLKIVIGKEQTIQYKSAILKHAKYENEELKFEDKGQKSKVQAFIDYIKDNAIVDQSNPQNLGTAFQDGNIFKNCTAIQVDIAAPTEQDVPVGWSSFVGRFNGMGENIKGANPMELHTLSIAQELREECHGCVVHVMNDGQADIRDSEEDKLSGEGVSVILKAGTGVAFAVYVDAEPRDFMAETSKAVLNLHCVPQAKEYQDRFQEGVLGGYCSQKGLTKLLGPQLEEKFTESTFADWLKEKNNVEDIKIGDVIGKLLEWAFVCNAVSDNSDDDKTGIINWINCLKTKEDRSYAENKLLSDWQKIEQGWQGEKQGKEAEIVKIFLTWTLPSETDFKRFLQSFNGQAKKLYKQALAVHIRRQLGETAYELLKEYQTEGIEKINVSKIKDLTSGLSTKALDCNYETLTPVQNFAVYCTWILGRWLADAVALTVDIFGAKEVRLGGGPLSGATGVLVTKSAEESLEKVYGFDLDPIWDPARISEPNLGHDPVGAHRIREVKRLRLVYPPVESGESGPRGAAKAGLDALIVEIKQRQLLECRDYAQQQGKERKFSSKSVNKKVADANNKATGHGGFEQIWRKRWLISDEEVETMLSREASALGLSRTATGEFRKLW